MLPQLASLIEKNYTLAEIEVELCAPLGIDVENIKGETKSAKALALVQYCQRRDRLADLIRQCRTARPDANWAHSDAHASAFNMGDTPYERLLQALNKVAEAKGAPGGTPAPVQYLVLIGVLAFAVLIVIVLVALQALRPFSSVNGTPTSQVPATAPDVVQSTQQPTATAEAPPTTTSDASPNTPAASTGALTPTLELTLSPGVTMELVLVPVGEFLMGSDSALDSRAGVNEQPQHRVYLSDFYIGRTEVTNAQYDAFAKDTGRSFSIPAGKDLHPVVNVSWQDADAFAKWLAGRSGRRVQLPTEAQWEKACRGTDGRRYPWGNEFAAAKLNSLEGPEGGTTSSGQYSPVGDSPYGAVDMSGNVWEWTTEWYAENAYKDRARSATPMRDPSGSSSGTERVLRSGSFDSGEAFARCTFRLNCSPNTLYGSYGFRVMASPS